MVAQYQLNQIKSDNEKKFWEGITTKELLA
jgi:hypothetical protein